MSLSINQFLLTANSIDQSDKINIENNSDALLMLDSDGFFLQASAEIENIIGFRPFDLIGTSFAQIISIQEIIKIRYFFQSVVEGEIIQFETILSHKNGYEVYVQLKCNPMKFNGKTIGVNINVKDIRNVKNLDDHSKNIVLDKKGQIIYASSTVEEYFGYSVHDVIGKSYFDFIHQDDCLTLKNCLQQLQSEKTIKLEIRHIHRDGYLNCLSSQFTPIFNNGEIEMIVVDYDLHKNLKVDEKNTTYYDYLTGLPNKNLFAERLNQAINTSKKSGKLTALLVLDCNNSTQIFDTYGRDVRDEVMKELARRLQLVISMKDTLSRINDYEFSIVFPEIREKVEVETLSNRIMEIVKHPIYINGYQIQISANIWISFYPESANEE